MEKKISNITVAIYTKHFAKNHSTTYKYLWLMCQPWITLNSDKKSKEVFDSMRPIDDTSLWKSRMFISSCFLNLWLEFTDSLFKSVTWYQKSMLPKLLEMAKFHFPGCWWTNTFGREVTAWKKISPLRKCPLFLLRIDAKCVNYSATNHCTAYRHLWAVYKPWLTLQPQKAMEIISQYVT